MTPPFEIQHLFIYFIAADRIERCVLFDNRATTTTRILEIDQSMFHYVKVTPIPDSEYLAWAEHLDSMHRTTRSRKADLTMAMAMYMKKMGIPAVKHGE